FYAPGAPLPPLSFPTRRSSDLGRHATLSPSVASSCTPLRSSATVRLLQKQLRPRQLPLTTLPSPTMQLRHPRHRQSLQVPSHLRSEEHTSELQSRFDLVCRLLL